jgi:predicted dienelactone hydrolase
MRTLLAVGLGLSLLLSAGADTGAAPDFRKPGAAAVETRKLDWKDAKRQREVPVRVYYPRSGKGPFPVVVFSHGLGGTRDGYEYLGRHWASHGLVCVHLQHKGSDDAVWKGSKSPLEALRKAARDPDAIRNRPLDVSFALDQIARLNREDRELAGRLGLARIGAAGHSFGAFTTLAVAGQTFALLLGRSRSFAEPRVKAAIAMSPNAPVLKAQWKKAFASIKIPILHMTGTKDDGVAITETKPADRRVAFDHIPAPHQYLVIFEGGDHMVFAGVRRPGRGSGKHDAAFHDHIRAATTAFWKAHLEGDAAARDWFGGGTFKKMLGKDGTFEKK